MVATETQYVPAYQIDIKRYIHPNPEEATNVSTSKLETKLPKAGGEDVVGL
jgi:hypothetical protein